MPLTKPPIDASSTEQRARELLNEFARGWFDGAEHATPEGDREFPHCEIAFGQTYPQFTRPLIHFVFTDRRLDGGWLGDHRRVKERCTLHVFVRVQNEGRSGNRADHIADNIADLLKLLFSCPSLRAPLAQKGLIHPRVLRAPVTQAFPAFQVRFMAVSCELTYQLAA